MAKYFFVLKIPTCNDDGPLEQSRAPAPAIGTRDCCAFSSPAGLETSLFDLAFHTWCAWELYTRSLRLRQTFMSGPSRTEIIAWPIFAPIYVGGLVASEIVFGSAMVTVL